MYSEVTTVLELTVLNFTTNDDINVTRKGNRTKLSDKVFVSFGKIHL